MMLLCIGVYAYAQKATPSVATIAALRPYEVYPEDVANTIGKPDKTESYKDQMQWTYNIGNYHLRLVWDTRVGRLQKYYFTNSQKQLDEWPQKKVCQLKTGETDVQQTIALLGTPKDMDIESNIQRLHYEFADNIVNLYYQRGKLLQYQLYGKKV